MYDTPCPPPPFEYPEYWPPHYSPRALGTWWVLFLDYGNAWAAWCSVSAGGYLQ